MAGTYVRAALAPEAPLGEVLGVTLIVGAVVLTRYGTFVYVFAEENETTAAWDAERRAELNKRTEAVAAAGRKGEPLPKWGELVDLSINQLLEGVELRLYDNVGTKPSWTGRSAGGTDAEWLATWSFGLPIPKAATEITLDLEIGGRVAGSCRLPV